MKKLVSWVLILSIFVSCIPEGFAEQFGENGGAGYVAVQTENGTTLRDQVIEQTLVMTAEDSLYLDGVIGMNGNEIRVESGNHTVSRDAVIKGDIVIAGPCYLYIDGLVEGNIRIDWTAWELNDPRDAEYAEKGLPVEIGVDIGEHAVVQGIIGSNFMGYIDIRGSVTRIAFDTTANKNQEYINTGWVFIGGDSYVYDIISKGDSCPAISVNGNSLVSGMSVDGHSIFHVDAAVSNISVANGGEAYCNSNGKIGRIYGSGADIGLVLEGSSAEYIEVETTTRQVEASRDKRRAYVAIQKGARVQDVHVSGCVDFYNDFFGGDDLNAFEGKGIPPEEMPWDELGGESRIENLTAQGNCKVSNNAYIARVTLKKVSTFYNMGYCEQIDAEDVRDLALFRQTSEEYFPNLMHAYYTGRYYQHRMFGTLNATNSNVFFGYFSGGSTALLDGCNVQLEDFNRIDTLLLKNLDDFFIYRGFELADNLQIPSYSIGHLIWNGTPRNPEHHFDNYLLHHIQNMSVIKGVVSLNGDVDRLLMYGDQDNARFRSSIVTYDGVRTEPVEEEAPADDLTVIGEEAEDAEAADIPQEEEEEEEIALRLGLVINPDSFYIGETVRVPQGKAKASLRGGASANKAAELSEGEYTFSKNEAKNWWYTLPCEPLQTLEITLDAGEGMGMMTLCAPDGILYTALSDGGEGKIEAISETEGQWKLCLIGGCQDYRMLVDQKEPARIRVNAMLQKPDLNGEGEKRETAFTAEQITVRDAEGKELPFIFSDNSLIMTDAAVCAGAKLTLSVRDENDAFVPAEFAVTLDQDRQYALDATVYAYGGYRVTCLNTADAHITLYDGNGDFYAVVPNHSGVFCLDKLMPGEYQAVMMRGDAGRWHFANLSELTAYGFEEKTDYRLDRFTLEPGYEEFYPMATIPEEPKIHSEWLKNDIAAYTASSSVCRLGGSVLMKLSLSVEHPEKAKGNTLYIDIPEGTEVDPARVMLSGAACDCRVEDGVLTVPVTGMEDISLEFYLSCREGNEIQTVAHMMTETEIGSTYTYLGSVALSASLLTINGPTRAGTMINLFGITLPREKVMVLMDGAPVTSTVSNANGAWNAVISVPDNTIFEEKTVQAVLGYGTEGEIVSESLRVIVASDTPEVESVCLYYYEHEHLRKLELSAAQLNQGRLKYNYLPGSAFTWHIRMTQNDTLTGVYFVKDKEDGTVEYLPCTYDEADSSWVYSGVFPNQNSSEQPLPFHLAYQQKETELPEFDFTVPEVTIETSVREIYSDEAENRIAVVDILQDGEVIGTSEEQLDFEVVEMDPIRAQEEAIETYVMDDGSIFCLMGDPEKPEDWYVLYFDIDDLMLLEEQTEPDDSLEGEPAASRGDGFIGFLQTLGLIASAHAEESEWTYEDFDAALDNWLWDDSDMEDGVYDDWEEDDLGSELDEWDPAAYHFDNPELDGADDTDIDLEAAGNIGSGAAIIACIATNMLGGKMMSVFNIYFNVAQEIKLASMWKKTDELVSYFYDRANASQSWQERQCWMFRAEQAEKLKTDMKELAKKYSLEALQEGVLSNMDLIAKMLKRLQPAIKALNKSRSAAVNAKKMYKVYQNGSKLLIDEAYVQKGVIDGLKSYKKTLRAEYLKARLGWKAFSRYLNGKFNGTDVPLNEKYTKLFLTQYEDEWPNLLADLTNGTLNEWPEMMDTFLQEAEERTEEAGKRYDEAVREQLARKEQLDQLQNEYDASSVQYQAALAEYRQREKEYKEQQISIAMDEIKNGFLETLYDLYLKEVDDLQNRYLDLYEMRFDACVITLVVTDAEIQYDGTKHNLSNYCNVVTAYDGSTNTSFAASKNSRVFCIAYGLPEGDSLLSVNFSCEEGDVLVNAGEYHVTVSNPVFESRKTYGVDIRYQRGKDAATFEILRQPLTIQSIGAKKVYDGTPLTASEFISQGLMQGDSIVSVEITGSQTEPGSSPNHISNAVIQNSRGEATQNYTIHYKPGMLTVSSGTSTPAPDEPTPMLTQTPMPTHTPATEPEPAPNPTSNDDAPTPKDGPYAPSEPVKDPSGYVYEGIWSNRLSDVKVSAFTLDGNNETVLWDAADYGQKNPTDTDEKGYYEWYVPDGYWQVLYEKDGYEPACSEWMEVPPPQTEVHQGLVSRLPAEIVEAVCFPDFVEVLFNRPVRVDTVHAESLSMGVPYTVEALDPERDGTMDVILAKRFRLIPEKALKNAVLRLTDQVVSYADVPCEPAEMECAALPMLEKIRCEGSVTMRPGETLDVPVALVCGGDASLYTCTVTGAHPDLLSVPDSISFDRNGNGMLRLEAKASGTLLLVIRTAMPQAETVLQVNVMPVQE